MSDISHTKSFIWPKLREPNADHFIHYLRQQCRPLFVNLIAEVLFTLNKPSLSESPLQCGAQLFWIRTSVVDWRQHDHRCVVSRSCIGAGISFCALQAHGDSLRRRNLAIEPRQIVSHPDYLEEVSSVFCKFILLKAA